MSSFQGKEKKCSAGVPPATPTRSAGVSPANIISKQKGTLTIRNRGYLPHLEIEDGIYFVTFRLADSLPKQKCDYLKYQRQNIINTAKQFGRELTLDEKNTLRKLFSQKIDGLLDAGSGNCMLSKAAVAQIVRDSFHYFEGIRYSLIAWCIMPNHVHVVVKVTKEHTLSQIIHGWKSYTSKKANKVLNRSGSFWQREYYDHLIRDEKAMASD
jgi:menaquinone-specific isochorismate synthase